MDIYHIERLAYHITRKKLYILYPRRSEKLYCTIFSIKLYPYIILNFMLIYMYIDQVTISVIR